MPIMISSLLSNSSHHPLGQFERNCGQNSPCGAAEKKMHNDPVPPFDFVMASSRLNQQTLNDGYQKSKLQYIHWILALF